MTDFTITLYTLYAIKQKYLSYNVNTQDTFYSNP